MNAHEVFRIVCGQGGCSPEYFFDRMTIGEARDFMEGVMMRSRSGWEQTRALYELIIKVMTGEEFHLPFPWDSDGITEETTEEDLEELRLKAERMEAMLNGKKRTLEDSVQDAK